MRRTFLFLFTIIMFFSCAGKQVTQTNILEKFTKTKPRNRFIPVEKKTLFVGNIFNHTQKTDLDTRMKQKIIDHFNFSPELTYTGSYNAADVYLGVEILNLNEEQLLKHTADELTRIRYYIKTSLSLKDVKSNTYWIRDVELESSLIKTMDEYTPDVSVKEAYDSLFAVICTNVESLIVNGTLFVNSAYGYEGFETEKSVLIDRTTSEEEEIDDGFDDGDEYDNLTEEERRELEIQEMDRRGVAGE